MIVELIAHTTIVNENALFDAGWTPPPLDVDTPDREPGTRAPRWVDQLAEFAGRLCYQSWARPNPATATNAGYLSNILTQQHYSVLEHASATFYVAEVSRSFSHELVRHRHLSFSQVSQRYVDESDSEVVSPPALTPGSLEAEHLRDVAYHAKNAYRAIVAILTERGTATGRGFTRKEARQAARSVLPNATKTKLVVTGNMRAWREVIAKRISPHADAEMQLFAQRILEQLKRIAPNTFQDIDA